MSLLENNNIAAKALAACEVPDCTRLAASGHLFCWEHWTMVPKELREKLWTAWAETREALTADFKAKCLKNWQLLARDARHIIDGEKIMIKTFTTLEGAVKSLREKGLWFREDESDHDIFIPFSQIRDHEAVEVADHQIDVSDWFLGKLDDEGRR